MHLLLHTIALEPARWTPPRVARPLIDLLPAIAGAGFHRLEIYEPHLALAPDEGALPAALAAHRLLPAVLSSYLELSPHCLPDSGFADGAQALLARVDRFAFAKVRLFPGQPAPAAAADPFATTAAAVGERLRWLAAQRPGVEFLLETHDGSLADEPARFAAWVRGLGLPNVGLLWQPTVFEADAARAQFSLQRDLVRHFHLQNRVPGETGRFATLRAGVVPWAEILGRAPLRIDASLEFVPAGVCLSEAFDLTATLQQAVEEFQYIVGLES